MLVLNVAIILGNVGNVENNMNLMQWNNLCSIILLKTEQ